LLVVAAIAIDVGRFESAPRSGVRGGGSVLDAVDVFSSITNLLD
jgi:hypothetical protein